MRSGTVDKYIGLMPNDFNLPNAILAACFKKYHDRVKYIEITFQPRQGGKNFMNPKRIMKIGWQSIKNFYQLRKNLKSFKG